MYTDSWLSSTRYLVRVQSCSHWAEHWSAGDFLLQVYRLQKWQELLEESVWKNKYLKCLNHNEDVVHSNSQHQERNYFYHNQCQWDSKVAENAYRTCYWAQYNQDACNAQRDLRIHLKKLYWTSAKQAPSHRTDYTKGKSHILTFSLGRGKLFWVFLKIQILKKIINLEATSLKADVNWTSQVKELSWDYEAHMNCLVQQEQCSP